MLNSKELTKRERQVMRDALFVYLVDLNDLLEHHRPKNRRGLRANFRLGRELLSELDGGRVIERPQVLQVTEGKQTGSEERTEP